MFIKVYSASDYETKVNSYGKNQHNSNKNKQCTLNCQKLLSITNTFLKKINRKMCESINFYKNLARLFGIDTSYNIG